MTKSLFVGAELQIFPVAASLDLHYGAEKGLLSLVSLKDNR